MLHDDTALAYLNTTIDHGRYIRWLQRGGVLRGR